MLTGLLGRKVGMTQIFGPNGIAIPVTVIEAGPCVVTQVKTAANDGYEAVQLGFGDDEARRPARCWGTWGTTLPQTRAPAAQAAARAGEGAPGGAPASRAERPAPRRAEDADEDRATETEADVAEGTAQSGAAAPSAPRRAAAVARARRLAPSVAARGEAGRRRHARRGRHRQRSTCSASASRWT